MASAQLQNTKFNNYADSVFSIMLILLFLVCIIILFVKGVFSSDDILEKGFSSVLSTSGASGSAVLYMKWKVLRNVQVKKAEMSEITDMLKNKKEEQSDE